MGGVQLHHDALDRLGQQIVNGDRPVGSVLTLADIEESYQVSRTVAREIMRVLEALGMVRSRRRVGITIRPRAEWNLLDPRLLSWRLNGVDREQAWIELAELRGALQPCAAALAARYATPAQAARLVELADQLAALHRAGRSGSGEYVQTDIEFHALLMSAGRNEMFAFAEEMIRLSHEVELHRQPEQGNAGGVTLFQRLAAAIAAGEAEAARSLSKEHVDHVLIAVGAGVHSERAPLEERVGVVLGA